MDEYRASGEIVATPRGMLFAIDRDSGPPVLCLHGIPTFSYVWRDVLPVVGLNHRTIALDLSGFGLSEKHPGWDYSIATQADVVRSALRQLDIDQVAIVAHDLGALVAAEMIAREPEICSHLVLLNTSLRRGAWTGGLSPLSILRLPFAGELALSLSRRWMLRRAMSIYVCRRERLTDEVMAHYWWPFDHGFKGTLLSLARNALSGPDDFDRWRTALRQLTIPCLIAWGAADPTFTLAEARDLKHLLPAARLQIFEHANHFVSEDLPRATGRLINAFLAGLD